MAGALSALRRWGADTVMVKPLAPNDNGKNGIYLGGDLSDVAWLPSAHPVMRPPASAHGGGSAIFHADVGLDWIATDGSFDTASSAKLVFYPQYPEVRLSGFVRGSRIVESRWFNPDREGRDEGRFLIVGLDEERARVAAILASPGGSLAAELAQQKLPAGVMTALADRKVPGAQEDLLSQLLRIHRAEWMAPQRLTKTGNLVPCRGVNCGGVTLESALGIYANSSAEPDYRGWEVKQHAVGSFDRPRSGPITLMTPEPTLGRYRTHGAESFIRTYGYPDKLGRIDRLNFGGIYRVGAPFNPSTHLRLVLHGYDTHSGRTSTDAALVYLDQQGEIAAGWAITDILAHWKRKHAKAAYVPSIVRTHPTPAYRYGSWVELGIGTTLGHFLRAIDEGLVYLDPALKLERASRPSPLIKRRSQFRISWGNLSSLYEDFRQMDLEHEVG